MSLILPQRGRLSSGAGPVFAYQSEVSIAVSDRSTHTYPGVDIGTGSSEKWAVVLVFWINNFFARSVSSGTIDGTAAVGVTLMSTGYASGLAALYAKVATNGPVDVVVNFSGTVDSSVGSICYAWMADDGPAFTIGRSNEAAVNATGTSLSHSAVSIGAGNAWIGGAYTNAAITPTYTDVTEQYPLGAGSGRAHAQDFFNDTGSSQSITPSVTWTGITTMRWGGTQITRTY